MKQWVVVAVSEEGDEKSRTSQMIVNVYGPFETRPEATQCRALLVKFAHDTWPNLSTKIFVRHASTELLIMGQPLGVALAERS